jgi:uncharacterized membrane protein
MNIIGRYLIVCGMLFCYSCAYDNAEDLYGKVECPPGGVSFTDTIDPIISMNCAVSGCHVNGNQLPALETYEQIAANAETVKGKTSNGTMPPPASGISLSQEEINVIACWVEAGAPQN